MTREWEPIVLMAFGLDAAAAGELVEGMAAQGESTARDYLVQLEGLPRALRHARLVEAFDERPDAYLRLEREMFAASEALRVAMYERLPRYFQTSFPELGGRRNSSHRCGAALAAFAERRIREATR